MKKLISLVLLILILSSCQTAEQSISMIVPSGSPELAQLYMQNTRLYVVDIVQGADPLVAAFASGSHDVIFAPTNLGAKMYGAEPNYVLLGVVVWGNLYLVSQSDLSDLENKEITVFGQNQTSDIILRHVFLEQNINAQFSYVDSVATATSLFLADPSRIILTAEPSFSKIQSLVTNLRWISLQEAYGDIHGTASYPQAGVFVKRDLDENTRIQIEDDLKESVERVTEQPGLAAILSTQLNSTMESSILETAIPNSNLMYQSASLAKDAIILYFEMMMEFNSLLIGQMPPDDFYGGQS
jgi:NitT/TauT family transport system substrate-binding protein